MTDRPVPSERRDPETAEVESGPETVAEPAADSAPVAPEGSPGAAGVEAEPEGSPGAKAGGTTRRRHRLPTPVRRIGKLLLLVLAVEYLVIPQIAGTRKAINLLGKVDVWYLLIGVALEAGSIIAYTQLTRALLSPSGAPSRLTLLRIQLSTLSLSHVVPGGSAAGASLGYRMLTSASVDGPDAGFALATQGLGSAVVLNVLLWVALVVSIPIHGFSAVYVSAAAVGAVLIGGFSALVLFLTKGEERASTLLQTVAAHLPLLDEQAIGRLVHRLAARLRGLEQDRKLLAGAVVWAAANWLLDASSLWVFVAAFGYRPPIDGLLVAFGLANVLAAIPLTPGGLGVIETVLTSTLVGFGAPRGIAILGVLSYRLVNFWLPIPIGGLSFLSLQVDPGDRDTDRGKARRDRRMRALSRLLAPIVSSTESGREWARRHGIKL